MNKHLEEQGCKLFQPLSLRTSIVPHYVPFDTACLISLFAGTGEKSMLHKIREVQERFWNRLFNLDKRVFHKRMAKLGDLRAMVFDRRLEQQWSIVLPLVQRIVNATVHLATGVAPSRLLFGDGITLDRHIIITPRTGQERRRR
jgi:hypothetical protein